MVGVGLLLNALVGSVASGFFLSIALRLTRQKVSPESQTAVTLFGLWWFSLSVYAVVGATTDLLAAVGVETFAVAIAFHYMQMIALCIGLWGLVYYVAFLFTGKRGLLLPLAIFYSLYYAVLLFIVTLGRPSNVVIETWRSGVEYAQPFLEAWSTALLLVLPAVVAVGTYLLLYFQSESRLARYRITLVSASALAWSASLVIREANVLAAMPALMALGSAWALNWAYDPPRWLSARAGLDAVSFIHGKT